MSCDHIEVLSGYCWFCMDCGKSNEECASDIRARLDAAEKRAAEAEAIANEAMRVGRMMVLGHQTREALEKLKAAIKGFNGVT